jgi:hypothetical protein
VRFSAIGIRIRSVLRLKPESINDEAEGPFTALKAVLRPGRRALRRTAVTTTATTGNNRQTSSKSDPA